MKLDFLTRAPALIFNSAATSAALLPAVQGDGSVQTLDAAMPQIAQALPALQAVLPQSYYAWLVAIVALGNVGLGVWDAIRKRRLPQRPEY